MTAANDSTTSTAAPPDENAQALAAIVAEAKRAGIRPPRAGEDRDAYLIAVARNKQVVRNDAHLTDVPATVKTLLERARSDEVYGHSPVGQALLIAEAIWPRMNPQLEGVGELGPPNRRGVRVPVAHLVRELQRDPARAQRLSVAESTLLALYGGEELLEAVEALRPAIDAAHARVRRAAEAELARPLYWDVLPDPPKPEPAPEPVPLGRGSTLSRSSITPIITKADLERRGLL